MQRCNRWQARGHALKEGRMLVLFASFTVFERVQYHFPLICYIRFNKFYWTITEELSNRKTKQTQIETRSSHISLAFSRLRTAYIRNPRKAQEIPEN